MKAGKSQGRSQKRYAPLSKATPRIATPSFWVYDQNPAQLLLQVHEPKRRLNPRPFPRRLSVRNYAPQCCFSLFIAHPSLSVHDQDRHPPSAALRGEADELQNQSKPGELSADQSLIAHSNPLLRTAEHCFVTPSPAPAINGAFILFGVNP